MFVEVKSKKGKIIFDYECKDYETAQAVLHEYLQNHALIVNECVYDVYKLDDGEYFGYIYE